MCLRMQCIPVRTQIKIVIKKMGSSAAKVYIHRHTHTHTRIRIIFDGPRRILSADRNRERKREGKSKVSHFLFSISPPSSIPSSARCSVVYLPIVWLYPSEKDIVFFCLGSGAGYVFDLLYCITIHRYYAYMLPGICAQMVRLTVYALPSSLLYTQVVSLQYS